MKLSVDFIRASQESYNKTYGYIKLFRGNKISIIENLGVTNDMFDCFDFCDNDLIRLSGFPPLRRIKTLLFSNNRISRIDEEFFLNIPNLETLILTNNKLINVQNLKPLINAKNLERLSLINNPVTEFQEYRKYLIYLIPSLKFLDFQKISQKEKEESQEYFNNSEYIKFLDLNNE